MLYYIKMSSLLQQIKAKQEIIDEQTILNAYSLNTTRDVNVGGKLNTGNLEAISLLKANRMQNSGGFTGTDITLSGGLDALTITSPSITGTELIYGDATAGFNNVSTKIGDIESTLSGKQNKLTAGDNINIVDNGISSTGGGGITQEQLDAKQDLITTATDISLNTLTTAGNINCNGFVIEDNKPRFRVFTYDTTFQATKALLFNATETVDFNINGIYHETGTLSGIYEATVSGTYWVYCKVRLPDSETRICEIQWYKKEIDNSFTAYENFEMWIGAAQDKRRASSSACLIELQAGEGIFPRTDLTGGSDILRCQVVFSGYKI
jgi:hypothetical protein